MARYVFKAKNPQGQDIGGEIDANNENEARVKLRAQRLIVVRIAPKAAPKSSGGGISFGGGVNPKDMQIFTRQLATLLGSGVAIVQSLDVLAGSTPSPVLKVALKNISNEVSQGKRFAEALANHPRVFDRFYINMVRAGEESGNIDQILNRLAIYIEKAVRIRGKIKGAMVYPGVIAVVAMAVVAVLMIFVIPQFAKIFKDSGNELPALTTMVINMSNWMAQYWYIVLGAIVAMVFGFRQYYRSSDGRKTIDSLSIGIPIFGDLIQKGAIARFTRTLQTLLTSGVSILEALDIASKVVENYVMEMAILRAKAAITEGKSLTVPLMKEKFIPQMVTQMIGVGEQTGNLDVMLGKIADFYEEEVDVAVTALTSILEPLMMAVIGGIVGTLVIAMYLPIFNLAGSASNG